MMRLAGVYKITNSISGKCYVGSSKNISVRFNGHRSALNRRKHQNAHLQSAWIKYGQDAFVFEVLLVCDAQNTRYYEQRAIDAICPEYNLSDSAFSGVPAGYVRTDEEKQKISVASKKNWQNTEYRQKVQLAIQEAMTQDERDARKTRTANLWKNPEYRIKSVNARKGNKFAKGYVCTPEQVENRRKAARISNTKRKYGDNWMLEYVKIYPEYAGDLNG